MKKILFFAIAILSLVHAQNIMSLNAVSGPANDTVTVSLSIANQDTVTGFQCDIPLPEYLTFVENSVTFSGREDDHTIVEDLDEGDTLTIFAYSMSLAEFSGNVGEICSFKLVLGTVPGVYDLALQNVAISDKNSQNIATGSLNGSVAINAPDIYVYPDSLVYERVPLLDSLDKSFTIQNDGNTDLAITNILSSHSDFEVLGSSAFNLTPGNSRTIPVRFHSDIKGDYSESISISSDDPDEVTTNVGLSATAYAVNELYIDNMFARSGYTVTAHVDISNMEAFTAFSFDLNIPSVMTLVPGSAVLSDRKTDHAVSASTLENGNIRIIAYSTSNDVFSGTSGEILSFDLNVDGQGGYYNLAFVDPVIADEGSNNILSDSYNGQLEIAAPDIAISPSPVNFGNVSVFDTATVNCAISNGGSDTLTVTHLVFYDEHFSSSQALPFTVSPGDQQAVAIDFHNDNEQIHNSSLRIRSNDPDENPKDISLTATSFIPNIMRVDSSEIVRNDTGWVCVSIENNEDFVGFQCDLTFAEGFTYLGTYELSDRSNGHSLSVSEKDGNVIGLFAYSMSQAIFSGTNGTVARLMFLGPPEMDDYDFELSDVIIANSSSENVMSSSEDGIVTVITSGPTLSSFPPIHIDEDKDTLFNISSMVSDPNNLFGDLTWTFTNHDPISLSVIGEDLFIVAETDWYGSRIVTIEVDDNELQDETSFSVTFDPVNDAPSALSDNVQTSEETSLEIILSATDIDNEAETLTYEVIDSTQHGYLEGTVPYLTYVPDLDYNGFDSLRFRVNDGDLSDTAQIVIEITEMNDPPQALCQSIGITEDSVAVFVLTASDVEDDELEFTILDSTVNGELLGIAPNLSYSPTADFYGEDSLCFIVSDGASRDTGKVNITITPVNDPPKITPGHTQIPEDTPTGIDLEATDIDNANLEFAIVDSTVNGTLSGGIAELVYSPDENFFGLDSLRFCASDGSLSDTGVFYIEILPDNDAPVWSALPDTSFDEDDSLKVHINELLAFVEDPDNPPRDMSISAIAPEVFHYGWIDSVLFLTADANWFGRDSIELQVSDGVDSASIIWYIDVLPVNDAPIFTTLINTARTFDAESRDTIHFADLFEDIDTPDTSLAVTITAVDILYLVHQSEAFLELYINDNISINETIGITLNDGDNIVSANLDVEIIEVAIELIPETFALHAPYPNPFNPSTTITYDIPIISDVSIIIYNVNGQRIRKLVDDEQQAKAYRLIWNGKNDHGDAMPSGMYICRITASSGDERFIDHRKMLFIK